MGFDTVSALLRQGDFRRARDEFHYPYNTPYNHAEDKTWRTRRSAIRVLLLHIFGYTKEYPYHWFGSWTYLTYLSADDVASLLKDEDLFYCGFPFFLIMNWRHSPLFFRSVSRSDTPGEEEVRAVINEFHGIDEPRDTCMHYDRLDGRVTWAEIDPGNVSVFSEIQDYETKIRDPFYRMYGLDSEGMPPPQGIDKVLYILRRGYRQRIRDVVDLREESNETLKEALPIFWQLEEDVIRHPGAVKEVCEAVLNCLDPGSFHLAEGFTKFLSDKDCIDVIFDPDLRVISDARNVFPMFFCGKWNLHPDKRPKGMQRGEPTDDASLVFTSRPDFHDAILARALPMMFGTSVSTDMLKFASQDDKILLSPQIRKFYRDTMKLETDTNPKVNLRSVVRKLKSVERDVEEIYLDLKDKDNDAEETVRDLYRLLDRLSDLTTEFDEMSQKDDNALFSIVAEKIRYLEERVIS